MQVIELTAQEKVKVSNQSNEIELMFFGDYIEEEYYWLTAEQAIELANALFLYARVVKES